MASLAFTPSSHEDGGDTKILTCHISSKLANIKHCVGWIYTKKVCMLQFCPCLMPVYPPPPPKNGGSKNCKTPSASLSLPIWLSGKHVAVCQMVWLKLQNTWLLVKHVAAFQQERRIFHILTSEYERPHPKDMLGTPNSIFTKTNRVAV